MIQLKVWLLRAEEIKAQLIFFKQSGKLIQIFFTILEIHTRAKLQFSSKEISENGILDLCGNKESRGGQLIFFFVILRVPLKTKL